MLIFRDINITYNEYSGGVKIKVTTFIPPVNRSRYHPSVSLEHRNIYLTKDYEIITRPFSNFAPTLMGVCIGY